MRLLLICFLLLPIFNATNAQLTKGNWLVGGNGSFSSTKYNSTVTASYNQTYIQISPSIGYFIIDKLAVGLRPGYSYSKAETGTNNYAQNVFNIGPFVRYYFLEPDKRVNILTEASYQHTISKVTDNPSVPSNGFSFLAGPVIYFNPTVGLEFTIGYNTFRYGGESTSSNTILLGLGLQIHLEKIGN